MFYDAVLRKSSKPNEKMVKVVVQTRPKSYEKRIRDLETGQIETVIYATGTEIVKEISTTEAGYKVWLAAHPPVPSNLPADEPQ